MRAGRIMIMAEMHGRDLLRRHVALCLLFALPFSFYVASSDNGPSAAASGGVALAFAVSGAALFSVLSSRAADQRLVLSGYRPFEMLLGRLLFLGPLALMIAGLFSLTIVELSTPARPWVVTLGIAVVALQSVPFGLAVGAAVPRELEGTLVLIGVVGIQLATRLDTVSSKVLPFYGPRQILEAGLVHDGPLARPLFQTFAYGVAMLIAARLFVSRRVNVSRHEPLLTGPRAAGPGAEAGPAVKPGPVGAGPAVGTGAAPANGTAPARTGPRHFAGRRGRVSG
ncbi:MAG TPA: hypothetical protein VFA83_15395 [Acidimicrobiales bacterium]|nr:hypothetical protein [Acidimicrobiales bacterium]